MSRYNAANRSVQVDTYGVPAEHRVWPEYGRNPPLDIIISLFAVMSPSLVPNGGTLAASNFARLRPETPMASFSRIPAVPDGPVLQKLSPEAK